MRAARQCDDHSTNGTYVHMKNGPVLRLLREELGRSGRGRLLAVAVMRLVVQDEDVLHAHQLGHDALDHLPFGLQRVGLGAGAALQELPAALRQLDALAQLEGVVVW